MRDGTMDGMQDFDSVIKDMIERKVITVEDGLGFATNQNNLLLSLKGLTSGEDFIRSQSENVVASQSSHQPFAFSHTE
jgi:Tfp pilus assembly ATPase PilU